MTRRLAKPFPVLLLLAAAALLAAGAPAQVAPAPPRGPRAGRDRRRHGGRPRARQAVVVQAAAGDRRPSGRRGHLADRLRLARPRRRRGLPGAQPRRGGQNVIGPELGPALGLLRTRELLAARAVDGGRQFFTRAYDFGYTRSIEETLRLWPKEKMVEDAVRILRRFKPQVVVSVFPGVPHPNHGQHQVAGVTAYAAFPLAGDPNALPQLAAEGLAALDPAGALPLDLLRSQRQHDHPADRRPRSRWPASRTSSSPWRAAACTARRRWGRSRSWGRSRPGSPGCRGAPASRGRTSSRGSTPASPPWRRRSPTPAGARRVQERLDAVQAAAERTRAAPQPGAPRRRGPRPARHPEGAAGGAGRARRRTTARSATSSTRRSWWPRTASPPPRGSPSTPPASARS